MKISFIAWTRYQRRSELIADHLGAKLHFIYYGQQGILVQAPLRYVIQAWHTWRVLCRDQPDIVFVQNPPAFSVLVCSFYANLHHARYVIDSHTGAFLSRKWRWLIPLQRILSRRALTTIVHNEAQARIISSWKCDYLVLADYPGGITTIDDCLLEGQFKVAVVSSYAEDEPLNVVFDAARDLKEASFYVTGDSRRIARNLLVKKPNNVTLTGYLSFPQYLGLLRAADVVLVLTTRDHTLLSGAAEAVSVGTPLIVSDWPILRNHFSLGTLHVPNNVEGVCQGIRWAQKEQAALRQGILHLREQLQSEWERNFSVLQDLIRKLQMER